MSVVLNRKPKVALFGIPGRSKTYSPGPMSLITASDRSAK